MGNWCSTLGNSGNAVNPSGPTGTLNARIIQALHIKRDENKDVKITFEK